MELHCMRIFLFLVAVAAQRTPRASIPAPVANAVAQDGTPIIDKTVTINGLVLRYKIAVPAQSDTKLGLNVLLHGDGGDSFADFPNANVQNGLMGVVVLAPNDKLLWGGQSTRTVQRPDGVAHATAVDALIRDELSKVANFDMANVWFSGVSGGSLLLSGFFMPMFMSRYKTGVMLMCGGLSPPEGRAGLTSTLDQETIQKMRIHWQSSTAELTSLKQTIPPAITYYETMARKAGLKDAAINVKQTADATPTGGHCAFDNKAFTSGIRKFTTSWAAVMTGDGQAAGIGAVNKGVVGREKLFG